MTNSLTMRFKSVKALVALLQNPSDPTAIVIKSYFQPYCDCDLSQWIIAQIENNNLLVINKIKELIANFDPTPYSRDIINPGPDFLLRTFCQGSDLYGVYADGSGSNSNSLIVLSSDRCIVVSDYFIKDSLIGIGDPASGKLPEIGYEYHTGDYGQDTLVTEYGLFYPYHNSYTGNYMEVHHQMFSRRNSIPIDTIDVEAGLTQLILLEDGSPDKPHWGDGTEFDIMLELDPTNTDNSQWTDKILAVGVLTKTYVNEDGSFNPWAALVLFSSYDQLRIKSDIDTDQNAPLFNSWGYYVIDLVSYETNMTTAQKNECNDVFISGQKLPYFFTRRSYDQNNNFIGYETKLKVRTGNNRLIVAINEVEVYNESYLSNANFSQGGLEAAYVFNRFFDWMDINSVVRPNNYWPTNYTDAQKQFVKDFYVKRA